jgi:hypothetical protein
MGDRFVIDTSDFLGLDYEAYKNELYAMALSTPADYMKLRKETLAVVKNQCIKDIYTQFYNLLSKGQDLNGTQIGTLPPPCYPAQMVSKFALKCARTMDSILEEAIEIILPLNFKELSTKRLEDQSKQNF